MNTNLERAVEYVLHNEGLFVNDPLDPGGATKYGITLATLSRWCGYSASVAEVRDLSRAAASSIYESFYWRPLLCDMMTSLPTATAILDCGVLFGIGVSAVFAQKAAASCGYPELKIDGHIGPKTIEALNFIDSKRFLTAFVLLFNQRIADIVMRRPQSARFEQGWENRVNKLLTLA